MNRFFFGNFDFEEQLHGPFQRPAKLERLILEMASCWLAIADAEDHIWCPGQLSEEFLNSLSRWNLPSRIFVSDSTQIPRGMEFVPWGWSAAAIEFGTRHGLAVKSPPPDVVRLANSREYSVSHETSSAEQDSLATLCRTIEEVQACIDSFPPSTRWVIKANWSHAARERVLGQGRELTPAISAWISQRITRDGVVCWEPWLQREAEIGIQWHISPGESPHLIAVNQLLVDPRGQYAGTQAIDEAGAFPDWVWQAVEATRPAVDDLTHLGYFGPVGIDAMRYINSGSNASRIRPFQDINARWTMGRLAAGWFEKLGQPATWCHGTEQSGDREIPGSARIATSPEQIDGLAVSHKTWLCVPNSTST